MCIGWNARGIPLRQACRGFDILEQEFAWAILLIQEFTNCTDYPSDISGHLVLFAVPPMVGSGGDQLL